MIFAVNLVNGPYKAPYSIAIPEIQCNFSNHKTFLQNCGFRLFSNFRNLPEGYQQTISIIFKRTIWGEGFSSNILIVLLLR